MVGNAEARSQKKGVRLSLGVLDGTSTDGPTDSVGCKSSSVERPSLWLPIHPFREGVGRDGRED